MLNYLNVITEDFKITYSTNICIVKEKTTAQSSDTHAKACDLIFDPTAALIFTRNIIFYLFFCRSKCIDLLLFFQPPWNIMFKTTEVICHVGPLQALPNLPEKRGNLLNKTLLYPSSQKMS